MVMATRIEGLPLLKVVDGDTVCVEVAGQRESIRIACLDTEESLAGSDKPVTRAGKLASAFAAEFFADGVGGLAPVDLEFDTGDPVSAALVRHRDNFGRLLAYVHRGGVNYALEAVRQGWSPYFPKYGRSRVYHDAFLVAEAEAQAHRRGIWDPTINAGGPSRDYPALLPWWAMRAQIVEDYRRDGLAEGVKSVRLDYAEILAAAQAGERLTVLADLQNGIDKWAGEGAVVFAGSKFHRFNLWIPDVDAPEAQRVVQLIQTRYAGTGRGYVYVSGRAKMFADKPEMVLADIRQLADRPGAPFVPDSPPA
jgi:micrococcal nuclease